MIVISAVYIKNFRIDASSDTLVAKNDKDFLYFNKYNKLFSSENFLVLAVKNNNEINQQFINKFEYSFNYIFHLNNI